MPKSKKFTNEEIKLLSSSPYVKNVRQNKLIFTYEFRCILYDEWIKQPSTFQIRETLKSYSFDCSMFSSNVINKINATFKRYGRPTNGKNKVFGKHDSIEKYDNEFLIDSGVFVKSKKGINFSSDFIDNASEEYPSVSLESLLESYGLDPKKVGYERIHGLKRKLENGENPKEKISADAVEKYTGHPYIKRCTAAHFTLKKQFYNESSIFTDYHIDEILDIFEIDGSDLPIRVRNKIKKQLISWNGDSDDIEMECDQEFKCRIQHNRMRALEKLSMMYFERIRKILPSLTSEQKKALCIWIRDWG
ncbi:hypothetical protein [Catenibacterium mitsuokai]|uniref:hypothetical protein n=1 Tax=Catenibacterium mitsuokai TaxID=100886 RepID=UPI00319E57AC